MIEILTLKECGRLIHNIRVVVFEEKTGTTKLCQLEHEMAKTYEHSLTVDKEEPLPISKINQKCNSGIMLGPKAVRNENAFNLIDEFLALRKAFWYSGIEKKNIAGFVG